MSSHFLCASCIRIIQGSICHSLPRQTQSQRWLQAPVFRPSSTVRRHGAAATPSPAPYQQKPSIDPGKNAASEPSSRSQNSVAKKRKRISKSASQRIAESLREKLPAITETYLAYASCEKLVKECARQAEYSIPQSAEKNGEIPKMKDGTELGVGDGWWYKSLDLNPTFETWAQVSFLHMYLLTVRLRCFPAAYVQPWHQHLIDHFSYMAEDRMAVVHKMVTRSERQKHLKEIFVQWRGLQTGYDEGLIKGDAVLATAVWRNIFKADPNVDWRAVGEVVSYMRHILVMLGNMSDGEIACGDLVFGGNPGAERDGVLLRARGMDDKGLSASSKASPAKGRMMPEGGS